MGDNGKAERSNDCKDEKRDDGKSSEYFRKMGKDFAKSGLYPKALEFYQKSYDLKQSPAVLKQIQKIKAACETSQQSDIDTVPSNTEIDHSGKHLVGDGFYLPEDIFKQLYPYQKQGVLWMWKLHRMNKGGVLGDDMGLGKTIQVIAFFYGLVEMEQAKTAFVVLPVSLIKIWEREVEKWVPGLNVAIYHGANRVDKSDKLIEIQTRGGLLLTSYGTLRKDVDLFNSVEGDRFTWDYMILDEGHRIKNPGKTTKAAHDINANHRIVLTGTPVQNNLKELWSLYDFTHQGTLLGTSHTFRRLYELPIRSGREKNASLEVRRMGKDIGKSLRRIINPYFLRRTKEETIQNMAAKGNTQMTQLSQKNDFIVWLYLNDTQIQMYKDFLDLDHVQDILLGRHKKFVLVELLVLKKMCDHPRLLSKRACTQLGLDGTVTEHDIEKLLEDEASLFVNLDVPDALLINESGKLEFLLKLLENLKAENHRTLVFSMSRKMLDIIYNILTNRNYKVLRLDGTVNNLLERDRRIELFQNDPSYSVFLLTTQVGGVGLTLTAADRVVIFDPSWNPATDSQAVDRVYRIGQRKDVVVYRLITCGSIEEKIYRRQVFKNSIALQVTGMGNKQNDDPYRYFTQNELRDLLKLDEPKYSTTQVQLKQLHSGQRVSSEQLDTHVKFVESLGIFGLSDHDLIFEGLKAEAIPHLGDGAFGEAHIQDKIRKAEGLLHQECQKTKTVIETTGARSTSHAEYPDMFGNSFGSYYEDNCRSRSRRYRHEDDSDYDEFENWDDEPYDEYKDTDEEDDENQSQNTEKRAKSQPLNPAKFKTEPKTEPKPKKEPRNKPKQSPKTKPKPSSTIGASTTIFSSVTNIFMSGVNSLSIIGGGDANPNDIPSTSKSNVPDTDYGQPATKKTCYKYSIDISDDDDLPGIF